MKEKIIKILVIALVLLTITSVVHRTKEKKLAYSYHTVAVHEVRPNETLWSIAKENSSNKQDVRRVIFEIQSLNQCSENLQIGDILLIPQYNQ